LLGRGGGGILAHPGASARARQAAQLAQQRGRWRGTAPWRGPTRQRGKGLNGVGQRRRGGRSTEARPPMKSHGGSPPWVRFCGGGAVARHGRGQVLAAVRSPTRQPSAKGGGERCLAIVSVWRSSSTKLIRPKATREGRTKLTRVTGRRGGASSIGLGEEWRRWTGLVWRKRSSGGPFYRRPGGDNECRRACHDGGDGANGDETARAGEG
jgi:hypothetical protein